MDMFAVTVKFDDDEELIEVLHRLREAKEKAEELREDGLDATIRWIDDLKWIELKLEEALKDEDLLEFPEYEQATKNMSESRREYAK